MSFFKLKSKFFIFCGIWILLATITVSLLFFSYQLIMILIIKYFLNQMPKGWENLGKSLIF